MFKDVCVVIRTWNRKEELRKTLERLREMDPDLEIIVVDNGSTDGTALMLTEEYSNIRLIRLSCNIGVEATNIGAGETKADYIFLLDDDAHPRPDCILEAVKRFKENPNMGILAFNTIDSPTGFCPQERLKPGKTDLGQKAGIKAKIFRGCGVMLKREVIEKVGGYPKEFFWCGEESDLAMRVLYAGYEIRYFPELIVIHRVSSLNRSLSKKTYFETRNLIWLYWKYSPVFMAMLKSLYSAIALGIRAIKNGVWGYYLRGLQDAVKGLPAIFKERKVVYTQTLKFALFSRYRDSIINP